jgi:large subunit ribosomal protein L5
VSAKEAKETKKESKGKKSAEREAPAGPVTPPRLRERYRDEILPGLMKSLGRDNVLSLPRLKKLVINMGVGSAITEKKHIEEAVAALTQIAGQKAVITLSRKAIAGFKLRENQAIGCKVTLRGTRMYEFLDRLISLALPRVRDFRGLNPDGFDGHGNYTLGLSEQLVFPELNPDKFTRPQGMHISLVTSTSSDDEARQLLRAFGMPFRTEAKETSGAA